MYAELDDVRLYLGAGATATGDDPLIMNMIEAAQSIIDNYTERRFEAVTATRYYESEHVEDNDLWLDEDLLTITTLTNGDSSSTTIPSTEYWLVPYNETPKYVIRLMPGSSYTWEFDTDYRVSVAGTWGFSETPPWAVKQAAARLAAFLYRQKDANVFDVTVIPEAGIMTIPQGLPQDVERLLSPYKRMIVI